MVNADSERIVVGQIGSPYGVQGWLKIQSYTEMTGNILSYAPWYIQNDSDDWRAIEVLSGREHGKGIIVKFSGIDSPEQARLLTGKKIAVNRSQLPPLKRDEYYWSDLKGLTVVNQNGETLGKVIYLIATGANDVLVVDGIKKQAIPFLLNKTVTRIDLEKKVIYVDWETL